ncbi:MAG: 16S rRNA (cytosine(1402)-N(4))-methyltransferase RsmH [Candidatus Omnitrophota bacterium]|nr:16S rRNA (cytosine(1402)-N(4))-methyltransferase RsmH [Candidatus Omnitrophota bacterium]
MVLHEAVMNKEALAFLNPRPGQVFVDCTLGMGGHAEGILKKISPKGRLIGIDRDEESLGLAKKRLEEFSTNCFFVNEDFRNLDAVLNNLSIKKVDGMLFDLGVSSWQLDSLERGFSIKSDAPLDMRMDKRSYVSAYDLVNSLSEGEIDNILHTFGEERFHNRIAHLLVEERAKEPISTTRELSDIVLKAIPYRYQSRHIHPATRTFQAFRIAVNRELEALESALDKAADLLKVGGRIGVISFHSLEDRIVKNSFKKFHKEKKFKIITKKPIRPTAEEMRQNPRSRSAKLRAAERI